MFNRGELGFDFVEVAVHERVAYGIPVAFTNGLNLLDLVSKGGVEVLLRDIPCILI